MFKVVKGIVDEDEGIKAIYRIHMNSLLRKTYNITLGNYECIRIIEPIEILDFHSFLNKEHIIITKSGEIQEEAFSLGKLVLVMRDTTDRLEGVATSTLKLVFTDEEVIYENFKDILNNVV